MRLIRLLLFPFSLCYGLVVILRNLAYDCGLFKSNALNIPVISVGNLAVGGAGKSPITAYLAKLFMDKYALAILSRGYGRKTRGFLLVSRDSLSLEVGDEPLQFKHQFPGCTIAVCEDRVAGINQLVKNHELILLDDAYQHRAVKPGLSILLFDFNKLFRPQWLLPTGDLREPLWGRKRANIILITKTPFSLSQQVRQRCIARIKPYQHQQVFFSYLEYGDLRRVEDHSFVRSLDSIYSATQILLVTGIAGAEPLVQKLRQYSTQIQHHCYPDHHVYNRKNMLEIISAYQHFLATDKLVITTEKDAQRLKDPSLTEFLSQVPIYYLPIQAVIHDQDKKKWDGLINAFVSGFN